MLGELVNTQRFLIRNSRPRCGELPLCIEVGTLEVCVSNTGIRIYSGRLPIILYTRKDTLLVKTYGVYVGCLCTIICVFTSTLTYFDPSH